MGKTLRDYGEERKEGVVSKVSYKFGKPEGGSLTTKEYTKVAFYTRVGIIFVGVVTIRINKTRFIK